MRSSSERGGVERMRGSTSKRSRSSRADDVVSRRSSRRREEEEEQDEDVDEPSPSHHKRRPSKQREREREYEEEDEEQGGEEEEEVEEEEEESDSEEEEGLAEDETPVTRVSKGVVDFLEKAHKIDDLLELLEPTGKASNKEKRAFLELKSHLCNARVGVEELKLFAESQARDLIKGRKTRDTIMSKYGVLQDRVRDQESSMENLRKRNALLVSDNNQLTETIRRMVSARDFPVDSTTTSPVPARTSAVRNEGTSARTASMERPAHPASHGRGAHNSARTVTAIVPVPYTAGSHSAPRSPHDTTRETFISKTKEVRRRMPWTDEEVETLLTGLNKFGPGKWREIKEWGKGLMRDELGAPEHLLHSTRTNVDLKDKARILCKHGLVDRVYGKFDDDGSRTRSS